MKKIVFHIILVLLFSSVSILSQNKIFDALHEGDVNLVKKMISNGADVNLRDNLGWDGLPGGPTILMRVVCGKGCEVNLSPDDQLSLIKYLLSKKAKINAKTNNGETALTYAVMGPHEIQSESESIGGVSRLPILKLLLDKGADPNAKEIDGYTPLSHASEQGYYKLVEYLLKRGARAGLDDALKYAKWQRHTETIKILQQFEGK